MPKKTSLDYESILIKDKGNIQVLIVLFDMILILLCVFEKLKTDLRFAPYEYPSVFTKPRFPSGFDSDGSNDRDVKLYLLDQHTALDLRVFHLQSSTINEYQ